ncbi:MAG: phosphatase PAP2 family protein [Candidatus Saccharimonadales bacterium]
MDIIRFLADGLLIIIVVSAIIIGIRGFRWRQWRSLLPIAVMAGLTSLLVGKLMSLVYQPSTVRPFIEHGVQAGAAYVNNPGFPSDHMLLVSAVLCAVYFLTPYRRLTMLLAVLAIVMGTARVIALVHTPIDIFGGVAAGLVGAVWYVRLRRSAKEI